jgi:hypothetical protein
MMKMTKTKMRGYRIHKEHNQLRRRNYRKKSKNNNIIHIIHVHTTYFKILIKQNFIIMNH